MGCYLLGKYCFFFFSSRRRHTRLQGDWSSDVCSSDLARGRVHREAQALALGDLAEGPLDVVPQPGEAFGRDVEGDGTRFDLGQIENIVDEGKKIRAGGIDGLRIIDLLRQEILGYVVREQLRQDQQAVQRRAQLVRHVRQKLGFVARGERELLGLFLERGLGLLDFPVLEFDLPHLLRKKLGLLLKLLVGALQLLLLIFEQSLGVLQILRLLLQAVVGFLELLLLALQFLGERLRLLEQGFGAHVCLDGVEHDADTLSQLIGKRQVRFAELSERGQLDDRLDLAFKQHRQDDDVQWRGRTENRADADVVVGDILEQNALLLVSALPNKAFADLQR